MARLRRQIQGHKPETVALLTSASPERLNAQSWLRLNRAHWGIENGLHQRLDVSYHDDLCRVRDGNGMGVLAIFRRLANSLCLEWISQQPKPRHLTTTDFATEMGRDNRRRPLLMVTAAKPSFRSSS